MPVGGITMTRTLVVHRDPVVAQIRARTRSPRSATRSTSAAARTCSPARSWPVGRVIRAERADVLVYDLASLRHERGEPSWSTAPRALRGQAADRGHRRRRERGASSRSSWPRASSASTGRSPPSGSTGSSRRRSSIPDGGSAASPAARYASEHGPRRPLEPRPRRHLPEPRLVRGLPARGAGRPVGPRATASRRSRSASSPASWTTSSPTPGRRSARSSAPIPTTWPSSRTRPPG